MKALNKVQLIGNLGATPELRTTTGGRNVCEISIATNDSYKNAEDVWVEKTEWHKVVFWGKPAETICNYAKKGAKMYIEGKIQTRKWQDKEGMDRYSTEVQGRDFLFLGGDRDGEKDKTPF